MSEEDLESIFGQIIFSHRFSTWYRACSMCCQSVTAIPSSWKNASCSWLVFHSGRWDEKEPRVNRTAVTGPHPIGGPLPVKAAQSQRQPLDNR
jgi:hypothetical protein